MATKKTKATGTHGKAAKNVAKLAKTAPAPEAKAKKLSQIDAAVQILGKTNDPMNCKTMVEAMTAKGLWSSPSGKTPEATLYAAILREITTKGKEARFVKASAGHFALAKKA